MDLNVPAVSFRPEQTGSMTFPDLGSRTRISQTGQVGVLVAPVPHTAWINYHEPAQGRIKVFAVLLDDGEVRFFVADALEAE
jgi:hypothetical protein